MVAGFSLAFRQDTPGADNVQYTTPFERVGGFIRPKIFVQSCCGVL